MAGEDFYVKFGSNVKSWQGELKGELQGVLQMIRAFDTQLQTQLSGSSARLEAFMARGGHPGGSGGGAGGGGGGGGGHGQNPATELWRDAARYNSELEGLVRQMTALVQGAGEFQRRSQGHQGRDYEREPGGTFTPAGGGVRDSERPSVRDAPPPKGGQPVTIAGTARVHIEDAAFKRVVDAVKNNVSATKDVRRSVDKLADRLVERLAAVGNRGDRGDRGKGKGKGGRPADPAPDVDPATDAAFTRASQLRAQVAARERLTALNKLQKGIAAGGEGVTPGLVKAASGGSQKFITDLKAGKTARIQKAIDTLTSELAGVPKMRQLQAELAESIIATGTDDGRRTAAYRQVAQQRRQVTKDAKAPAPAQQARDTSTEALRAERQQGIGALKAVLPQTVAIRDALKAQGAQKAQIDAANAQIKNINDEIERLSKPLKREAKADRRAQAKADRATSPRPGQQEVEDQLTHLALPGDPEMFREMVRKRDITRPELEKIAQTFTRQGYATPYNTKTRVPELTERIVASRQSFDAAGGQLAIPLTSKGTKVSSSVRRDVRNYIARILDSLKLTVEEEAALQTLEQNRLAGGGHPGLQSRSGARSQDSQAGTRQPFQRGKPAYPIYGAGFGDEAGREQVQQARETMTQHYDSVTESAIRKAGELVQREPTFNPYDPAHRAGITGTGPDARAAQEALRRLTRAIEAWDRRMDPAALGAGSPVRAGIELRGQARASLQEQQQAAEEQRRLRRFTQHAVQDSAQESLVGPVTGLGTARGGGGFTRLFPGLRAGRGGLSSIDENYISPDALKPVQRAMNRYVKAFRVVAEAKQGGTPEELQQASIAAKRQLQRFIEAYEKASGTTLPTSTEQVTHGGGYDSAHGYQVTEQFRSYSLAQQRAAVDEDKRQDALARARARRAGPDPAILAQESKNASKLARQIGGVSYQGGSFVTAKGKSADVDDLRRQYEATIRPTLASINASIRRAEQLVAKHSGPEGDPEKLAAQQQRLAGLQASRAAISVPRQTPATERYEAELAGLVAQRKAAEGRFEAADTEFRDAQREHLTGARTVPDAEGERLLAAARSAHEQVQAAETAIRQTRGNRPVEDKAAVFGNLQAASAAFAALQRGRYDTARGRAGATGGGRAGGTGTGTGGDGTGGGGTGGGPGGTGGHRPAEGGGEDNILRRMLAELVGIHATLRTGVSSRPGRATPAAAPTTEEAAARANAPAAAGRRQQAVASQYATPAGRAALFAGLPEDLAAAMVNEDKLAAATKLVTRGFLSQAQAVALFRQEEKLTRAESKAFAAQLRASVGDANLGSSVQRGQERETARQRGQARLDRSHGGYDPALGYGTVNQWAQGADRAAGNARALARAQTTVADTMGRLSPATQREIAELRRLIQAGSDSVAVARQQVIAYRAMANELAAGSAKVAEQRQRIAGVFRSVGAPSGGAEVREVSRVASLTPVANAGSAGANRAGGQLGSQMAQGTAEGFNTTMLALFGGSGFASRVMHSIGTFLVRNFSAGLVFGITNAMQDAIQQGVETESTFVRVSQALEQTGRSSSGLRTQLQGLSEGYGVALKDVYTTAAGITGLFDRSDVGNEQLLALTKVAVQLELISGGALNATEAMRSLSSVTSAYGEDAPEHMADVLTTIQNQLSVNIEESIEGVARLSGQAKLMGIDFEHAATYVASIAKFTGQTGAGAGEQLSRMLESIQKGPTQKVISQALKTQGIDVRGAFAIRDYQSAIDALMGSYGNLSKSQQAQVAIAIGGARQAASTNAWLIEGAKSLNTINAAYHSNGVAQERASQISKQLTAQLARARAAFVNFFGVLVRTGVLDAFGAALVTVRIALTAVNHTLSLMNDLLDSSPFTQEVRKWVLLIGGLVLGFNLARRAAAGMAAAVNASVIGRSLLGRGAAGAAGATGAAGAAGAAEGGAVAGAGLRGGAAGTAGQAGLLALLLGGRGGRVRAGRNPNLYASSAAAFGVGETTGTAQQRLDQIRYRQMQAESLRSAPAGSAMLTPLGRASVAQRFGPVDENGAPAGRRQRLFARQSVRLGQASSFLGDRAESLRGAAQTRQLGGYARNLGYGDDVGASVRNRALARAQLAAAGGLQGAARVTSGMSSAFAGMSRNVAVSSYAFAGLAAVAAVLITSYKHNKEMSDRLAQGFDQAWGATPKQPVNPTQAQNASAYFSDVLKFNQNANAPDGGSVMGGLTSPTTWGLSLGRVGKSLWQGGLTGFKGAFDRNTDRDAGVTTSDQDKKFFQKPLHDTFNRLHKQVYTVKEIDKVIATNDKEISDTAKSIRDSGASKAQQASMLRDLANMQEQLHKVQDGFRLAALGMNSLDTITQDQLDAIGPMVNSIVGFGSNVSRQFAPLIKAYVEQLGGFDPGSTYQKGLDRLTAGGTSKTTSKYVANPTIQRQIKQGELPSPAEQVDQGRRTVSFPGRVVNTTRFTPDTPEQRQEVGLNVLKTAALSAQAKVGGMSKEEIMSDEGQKYLTSAFATISTYYQAVSQHLQSVAAGAQAVAEQSRMAGNFGAAANQAAALVKNAQAQLDHGDINKQQYSLQVAQINDQAAQDRASQAGKGFEEAKLYTRNQIGLAQLELGSATASYNELKKGGASYQTLLSAQQRMSQAGFALQDQQAEANLAAIQTQLDASTAPGDAVAQANSRLQYALAAQRDAATRLGTNSAAYQQATQGVIAAQRDITRSQYEVAAANSQLAIAYATAHGDSVKTARLTLRDAQRRLREAINLAGGNRSAAEVKAAQAAVVQSQQAYRDAINETAEASSNLLIAYANAGGQTVRAAQLALSDARRKLQAAKRKSAGANTSEVKNAQAEYVTAQAAARDAQLQDSLDTIGFNQQMGYITAQSAIKQLQALLREKDLTKQQRRSIMLQIHGLQQDLVSSLTSSGFNIPGLGDLKLPSPYEVRRSIGVDKIQKVMRDAVVNSDGGFSLTAMKANIATGAAANTGANGDLINAVKSVQTAIENRGATKVSVSQQNHFTTPTTAAAKAIAHQVIEIINQQTSAQARATTSTPRHVPTR